MSYRLLEWNVENNCSKDTNKVSKRPNGNELSAWMRQWRHRKCAVAAHVIVRAEEADPDPENIVQKDIVTGRWPKKN